MVAGDNKRKRMSMLQSYPLDKIASLDCDVGALSELGDSNHSAWLNWRTQSSTEPARVQSFALGRCKVVRVQHDADPARGPPKTNVSFVLESDGLNGAKQLNKLVQAFAALPQFKSCAATVTPFRLDEASGDIYLNTSLYETARTPCVVKNHRNRTIDVLSLSVGQYVNIEKLMVNCATVYDNKDGVTTLSIKANPKLILAEEPVSEAASKEMKKAMGKTTTFSVADLLK